MKKVIIFSNYGKLYSVNEGFASRADIVMLDTSSILFSENGVEFSPIADFSGNGLYLVFDEMPEETFNNIVGVCDRAKFYILVHSEPKYVTGFKNIAKGSNVSKENGGKIYPDVVSILEDMEGQKLERIIKEIFKINPIQEAKMKLKNEILNGDAPEIVVDELREFQPALDDFRKTLKEKNLNYDDWFTIDYGQAFSKFLSDLKMEE